MWLQPRPGSDLALALAMIQVIISKNLCDMNFVDAWTFGFDLLEDHIGDYSPRKVEEITWVPAEKIRQAALLYCSNKACLYPVGKRHRPRYQQPPSGPSHCYPQGYYRKHRDTRWRGAASITAAIRPRLAPIGTVG